MKLIAGSYSILRRREHESRTVFLYNVTEDSQEIYDLRLALISVFIKFSMSHPILLITYDYNLCVTVEKCKKFITFFLSLIMNHSL